MYFLNFLLPRKDQIQRKQQQSSFESISQLLIILTTTITTCSSSDCDVEWIYSDNFNSPGFKVTCNNLQKGENDLIRNISAYNAIILNVKNSTLYHPKPDIFENVPKIKELSFEKSKLILENATNDFFGKLEQLQILSLTDTALTEIKLKKLNRLRTLHLDNVNVRKIDGLALNELESFEFTRNHLEKIEDVPLCNLPNIRKINFGHNNLGKLKKSLYTCSYNGTLIENNHLSIESIDLSFNKIPGLSKVLPAFLNLLRLNLEANQLSQIHEDDFLFNINLEWLNLKNNSISNLSPSAFARLIKLKTLNLSHNRIGRIQIKFLPNLVELDLSFNRLNFASLSKGVTKLPKLKNFYLSHNELNGTSYFFDGFPTLETLDLNENNVILFDDMFVNLSRIEKLYLRQNGIVSLPKLVFRNMSSLVELDLSLNKLDVLDYQYVFSNLTNLLLLNLSYNLLEDLNSKLFVALDDVRVLDISGNRLLHLDYPLMINSMRALEVLNINDNMFSCNFLHDIVKYFSWKGIYYHSNNMTSGSEKDENIGGIHCREEVVVVKKNGSEIVKIENRKNYTAFIVILSLAILAVLFFLVLIMIKYYQFHIRTKYQCDQFELIED